MFLPTIKHAHYLTSLSCVHTSLKMRTRRSGEKRKELDRIYHEKHRTSDEKKEAKRIYDQGYRKRQKLMKRFLSDRLLESQEREEELKKALRKSSELGSKNVEDREIVQEDIEQLSDLPLEESEDEEISDKNSYEEMEKLCEGYATNEASCHGLISMTLREFESFVLECSPALSMTTYRGTQRIKPNSASSIPSRAFIFLTLFWMRHYLTIDVISHLFKIEPRSCTRILKRTTVALAKTLANEIRFPSDQEMEDLQNTEFQNLGFCNCVCVVDGTEIQISRPKNSEFQTKTYSGKKKQNSLNVMVITKLNGEIIYHSSLRVGAHDQSHWNELKLREMFVDKEYGIMGDGGFTFNRTDEEIEIHGYKPRKKPKGGTLTLDEKEWNRKLSEVRVVVENSIRVIKTYKILSGVFRHWRNGKGQIDGNHVLTICIALANRRIKQKPLRAANWKASDHIVDFDLLAEDPPDQLQEMLYDV